VVGDAGGGTRGPRGKMNPPVPVCEKVPKSLAVGRPLDFARMNRCYQLLSKVMEGGRTR